MKVLVVDDSAVVRKNLKLLIKQHFEVIEASDGADALQQAHENDDISLFIVDINMPRMDGISFVELLRAETDYKTTPVMMVTTESNVELVTKAKELGVKAWVIKPFNRNKIILAVKKLLNV